MNKLEEKIKELRDCQLNTINSSSCVKCEKFFDCPLRKQYVDAVYKSMNNGKDGGFNF